MTDKQIILLTDGFATWINELASVWIKAKEVREKQKRYFRTKAKNDLTLSKIAEKELDDLLEDLAVNDD